MQRNIQIQAINPYLMCTLCGGYLIDASTLVECLHSFCKSCLVKYLESSYDCPKCSMEIHKTKPWEYIRSDPCLQEIVYKLVPDLFTKEETRKQSWKKADSTLEEAGPSIIRDEVPDDARILVTLKYFRGTSRMERIKTEKVLQMFPTRYLCCNPDMPVRVLKKFVCLKFDISSDLFNVELWRGDETLLDELTLKQLVQIYGLFRERKPLDLHFSLYPKFDTKPKKDVIQEKKPIPKYDPTSQMKRVVDTTEMKEKEQEQTLDIKKEDIKVEVTEEPTSNKTQSRTQQEFQFSPVRIKEENENRPTIKSLNNGNQKIERSNNDEELDEKSDTSRLDVALLLKEQMKNLSRSSSKNNILNTTDSDSSQKSNVSSLDVNLLMEDDFKHASETLQNDFLKLFDSDLQPNSDVDASCFEGNLSLDSDIDKISKALDTDILHLFDTDSQETSDSSFNMIQDTKPASQSTSMSSGDIDMNIDTPSKQPSLNTESKNLIGNVTELADKSKTPSLSIDVSMSDETKESVDTSQVGGNTKIIKKEDNVTQSSFFSMKNNDLNNNATELAGKPKISCLSNQVSVKGSSDSSQVSSCKVLKKKVRRSKSNSRLLREQDKTIIPESPPGGDTVIEPVLPDISIVSRLGAPSFILKQKQLSLDAKSRTGKDIASVVPDEKPVSLDEKPVPQDDKPVSLDNKPVSLNEKPVSLNEKPVSLDNKPGSLNEKPVPQDEKPVSLDEKPVSQNEKPVSLDEKPAFSKNKDTANTNSTTQLVAGESNTDVDKSTSIQENISKDNDESDKNSTTSRLERDLMMEENSETLESDILQILESTIHNDSEDINSSMENDIKSISASLEKDLLNLIALEETEHECDVDIKKSCESMEKLNVHIVHTESLQQQQQQHVVSTTTTTTTKVDMHSDNIELSDIYVDNNNILIENVAATVCVEDTTPSLLDGNIQSFPDSTENIACMEERVSLPGNDGGGSAMDTSPKLINDISTCVPESPENGSVPEECLILPDNGVIRIDENSQNNNDVYPMTTETIASCIDDMSTDNMVADIVATLNDIMQPSSRDDSEPMDET